MNVQTTKVKQRSAPRALTRPTSLGLCPKGGIAKGSFGQRAPLNRKKHARHVFIHKARHFFKNALPFLLCPLAAILLLSQCANVKGIFTDDNSTAPTKAPDPSCLDAAQPSGFNDGDGASEDTPYLICTYAQLGMMSSSLSAHYALGDNIDASSSNWTPVGDNSTGDDSSRFTGTLDGRDYMISDLRVNITEDYGGLFGYTGEHSEIRSVGLSGVNVMAEQNSGGLVGYNNGSISNSYATGEVFGSSNLGILVGYNTGSISSSYATGEASGSIPLANAIGGLTGYNEGSISNSYTTNTTSGARFIAGLVGDNNGSISNSYATGTVSSTQATGGGLVGVNAGSISNSYATGTVTGSFKRGGLIGDNNLSGTIDGINYFADDIGGGDGIGSGTACDAAVCMQAMGSDDAARATWLEDSLDETADSGLNWDAQLDDEGNAVWGNLNASGFPCLKNMPAGARACL